jgi:radical SAM superfamily enzyme YgiQ (UPF0313 family)
MKINDSADFLVKVLPIALGQKPHESAAYSLATLTSYAKQYKDGKLRNIVNFLSILPYVELNKDDAINRAIAEQVDIVALSSFGWTHELNLYAAERIKAALPNVVIVIGGPHIPKREKECAHFLNNHPYIDIAARGEGEVIFSEIIDAYCESKLQGKPFVDELHKVNGITFRKDNGELERNPDQGRFSEKELAEVISPYTSGEMDQFFSTLTDDRIAPFETNRGCPYGCTFCDWGSATLEKVNKLPMERIYEEIEFFGRNKIAEIFITDANFGMLARDNDIAKAIVASKKKYGFPTYITVNYSKNTNQRVVDVVETLWEGGLVEFGLLSAQTTDATTLENIDRWNIKPEQYSKLLQVFREKNIPVAADLMIGLPGQNTRSLIADFQFFFERKVLTNAYWTAILPNSPMAEDSYKEKFNIVTDAEGVIQSNYSFFAKDREETDLIFRSYQLLFKMGILRYFLYFLQADYGISGIELIYKWTIACRSEPEKYPVSAWAFENMLNTGKPNTIGYQFISWKKDAQHFFENLPAFYNEIKNICLANYGVALDDSDADAIFIAQAAIMPKLGHNRPLTVSLPHDVVGYFAQINTIISLKELPADFQPLRSFPPSTLHIENPGKKHGYGFMSLNAQKRDWEVDSPLRQLGI